MSLLGTPTASIRSGKCYLWRNTPLLSRFAEPVAHGDDTEGHRDRFYCSRCSNAAALCTVQRRRATPTADGQGARAIRRVVARSLNNLLMSHS